jgi:polo-like kinase 4
LLLFLKPFIFFFLFQKIADFGLAAQLKRPDERHMTLCGTPNFISPEVAGRSSHGMETDVWSLGCMLYTMLVGRPPFETEGVRGTLSKVMRAQYDVRIGSCNSGEFLLD